MKKRSVIFAIILTFCLATHSFAALNNSGFESGDTTGWTISSVPDATVTTVGTYYSGQGYQAPLNDYFLQLSAGSGTSGATTASQTTWVAAGTTINGFATFDGQDQLPNNDFAFVRILLGATQVAEPWSKDISLVGDYLNTAWEPWSWTATASDNYTLQYGVGNGGDNSVPSYAGFDMSSPIPEPSTYMYVLLAIALGAVEHARRKMNVRKQKGESYV